MEAFPDVPTIQFDTTKRAMAEARRFMALQVLKASGTLEYQEYLSKLNAQHISSDLMYCTNALCSL